MGHPWEQQPNEPFRAWQAFVWYRDRRRSISQIYVDSMRMPTVEAKDLHDAWDWRGRVLAHDKYLEDIRQEEKEAQARDAVAQTDRTRAMIRTITELETEKRLAKAMATDSPTFADNHLVRLFEVSHKAETLAQGKPTEIQSAKVDLSKVSTQDLAALLAELESE